MNSDIVVSDSQDILMKGTDGDKPEAGDIMNAKEANPHKDPVLFNFDVSQPLIGPVPAKVNLLLRTFYT